MTITATELKENLGKYLDMAMNEDILITKNGKLIAKMSNPYEDRVAMATSLFGVLKDYDDGKSYEEMKMERLAEKYESND